MTATDAAELVRLTVACDDHAPGTVREAVSRVADDESVFGDVMLVASELVTNAVRHSGAGEDARLDVIVRREPGQLLISVRDPGCSGKTAQVADLEQSPFGGLGLRIVEQLSAQWGQERGDGYRVWAKLPTAPGSTG